MKKNYPFIIIILLLVAGQKLEAQDFDNPGEYMSFISKQRTNVTKKFMAYASASAHGKRAKKVDNLRMKLLDEVQESRMNISGMPSFKGDKSFRDTTVNFMKLYFNVLNEDYAKIINMEEVSEQSYDAMEAYFLAKEMVDKKLDEGNKVMQEAQTTFAKNNNVNLIKGDDELGQMTTKVHESNAYYHQLYLLFFKPYKQDVYLMDAISKGNITGIEQNKSSLLKYAEDGLVKLADIKPFDGDNTLVLSCKKVMNFYVKVVKESMNAISDFFLNKEAFEKLKKEFEKKSNPSKEEVEAYNKGVKDINNASDAYNQTNKSLNQQRNEVLKDWDNAVNAFFDEHTPRYK